MSSAILAPASKFFCSLARARELGVAGVVGFDMLCRRSFLTPCALQQGRWRARVRGCKNTSLAAYGTLPIASHAALSAVWRQLQCPAVHPAKPFKPGPSPSHRLLSRGDESGGAALRYSQSATGHFKLPQPRNVSGCPTCSAYRLFLASFTTEYRLCECKAW